MSDNSGRCKGTFANDWPLVPGTFYYQPNGLTVFNVVNENGVFDGEFVTLQDAKGNTSIAGFGLVCNRSIVPLKAFIDAWAFDNMNPTASQASYTTNLAYCQNWTSANSSVHGSVGSAGRFEGNLSGPVPVAQWGNYYNFQDNILSYLFNIFNSSAYYTCDGKASLICVG